ncbi:hypothetical protein [Streptomyces sp. NPDC047097]|uniref:hypothetical protein n=1 Tax=Streptomyces sp. NPDC047097 TaxID=3155260 RepID=UPI0033E5D381
MTGRLVAVTVHVPGPTDTDATTAAEAVAANLRALHPGYRVDVGTALKTCCGAYTGHYPGCPTRTTTEETS